MQSASSEMGAASHFQATATVVRAPPRLPAQAVGPHFELAETGVIVLAPPEALDRAGNHVQRLRVLHPVLCDLSRELVQKLSRGNAPHAHLRGRVQSYREIIDRPLHAIDFWLLYIEGVRLANAYTAAEDEVSRGDLPPLDEPMRERIDTVLRLHGTFLLSTVEGQAAIDAEERYQRRPDEEREVREAGVAIAATLANKPDIIEPSAAAVVMGAAEQIGQGAHPERSGVAGTGTLRNAAITIIGTAAIAVALPVVGGAILGTTGQFAGGVAALILAEGLKRSKSGGLIIGAVSSALDQAATDDLAKALPELRPKFQRHVAVAKTLVPKLRVLAGKNDQFAWINETLDWLERHLPTDDKDGS